MYKQYRIDIYYKMLHYYCNCLADAPSKYPEGIQELSRQFAGILHHRLIEFNEVLKTYNNPDRRYFWGIGEELICSLIGFMLEVISMAEQSDC